MQCYLYPGMAMGLPYIQGMCFYLIRVCECGLIYLPIDILMEKILTH